MKCELDEYQHRIVSCPYDREKINELLLERHLELTDPDKKIWSRLRRGGLVQRYVNAEYNKAKRQQRLPPNEAAFNYNARRADTSITLAQAAAPSRAVEKNLSNFEFFEKYMRSDESLAPSKQTVRGIQRSLRSPAQQHHKGAEKSRAVHKRRDRVYDQVVRADRQQLHERTSPLLYGREDVWLRVPDLSGVHEGLC